MQCDCKKDSEPEFRGGGRGEEGDQTFRELVNAQSKRDLEGYDEVPRSGAEIVLRKMMRPERMMMDRVDIFSGFNCRVIFVVLDVKRFCGGEKVYSGGRKVYGGRELRRR